MSQTAAAPDTAMAAQATAHQAATRAGVHIRELTDLPDIQGASQLFDAVWTDPTQTIMPVNLVRALSSAGAYVAGAFLDRRMVGAIIGFVGLHHDAVVVHSHILGVLPETRGRSVGFALKQHQRAWCLQRGIDTIGWTFDPLVRRNAYFNLCKLGAVGSRYETNFYGPMDDGINAGDETDRLVVTWRLTDDRVLAAAEGRTDVVIPQPATVLLDADAAGRPRLVAGEGPVLRCGIPDDILAIRERDPALALQWRHALRDTLGAAVQDGYTATGMDRAGWYTLTRSSGG
jgi:predicted GNAT superfamily acetyltransferase